MGKRGHEAPHFDFTNKADLTSHASHTREDQLRIGDTPEEVELRAIEVAKGLTPEQEADVDRADDQGMWVPETARLEAQGVPRRQAERITNAHAAKISLEKTRQARQTAAAEEAERARLQRLEETRLIFRDEDPSKLGGDKAA